MSKNLFKRLLLISLIVIGVKLYAQTNDGFLLQNGNKLLDIKKQYQSGNAAIVNDVNKLLTDADKALNSGPYAVTLRKTKTAPTGDIHDYVSQAPYWWADPSKPDGKPYIRKDGERNPEIYLLHDDSQMNQLCKVVKLLGFAYYFTGKETYAKKSADLLTIWFISKETRMNPNLNYAQYIPGLNDGRGTGIIESRGLSAIPDALVMMQDSKSISPALNIGVKAWFTDYLKWLISSKNGKDEMAATNNHGTMFDLQVIDFALFTGDKKLAYDAFVNRTLKRIDEQFTPEGKQPLELARTKSWSYSSMNLNGWCKLAVLAGRANIDLWHKETNDGKSIKKCLEYLMPYLLKQKPWTQQQIEPMNYDELLEICSLAADKYPDMDFKKVFAMYKEPLPWM
jgi:hypothetical protein